MRAHQDLSLEFSDGVNVLVGPNACGKTTVLEAVALSTLGTNPNGRIKDVVADGSDWARIDVQDDGGQRTLKLTGEDTVLKTYELSGVTVKRLRHDQILPTVWFDPEQLRLLRGSPARRREYLDGLLSQIDAGYLNSLRQYNRALKQRNALLKAAKFSQDQMFVWNIRIVEHAKYIQSKRVELVSSLNSSLGDTYASLAGKQKDITTGYSTSISGDSYGEALLQKLEQNVMKDRALGFTSAGPHRDDLVFLDAQGKQLNATASRGEVRTLVLSLKVLELQALEEYYGSKPVLLFDDVFSELDGARRRAFTEYLTSHQAIITTTDADIVTKDFAKTSKIIAIA